MTTVILDLETNGLLENVTEGHCLVAKVNGNIENYIGDGAIREFYRELHEMIDSASPQNPLKIIGHNIIGYDLPVLAKLYHDDDDYEKMAVKCILDTCTTVIDTMIMSQMLNQKRPGGHSLESVGKFFDVPVQKVAHEDWTVYSDEMLQRCENDVELTAGIYHKMKKAMKKNGLPMQPIIDECKTALILEECRHTGIPFDHEAAEVMSAELEVDYELSLKKVQKILGIPPHRVVKWVYPKTKKDGGISRVGIPRWIPLDMVTEGASFMIYEPQPIHAKLITKILDEKKFWKPTVLTDTAYRKQLNGDTNFIPSYKLNEDNLNTVKNNDLADTLLEYLVLKNRLSTLKTWYAATRPDNRIHGTINSIGTWTHRCAHVKPNLGTSQAVQSVSTRALTCTSS